MTPSPNPRPWIATEFLLGAVLINVPYLLLIQQFDYPDILRESPGHILSQLHGLGGAGLLTWLAFSWVGFPLLLGVLGLHPLLRKTGHPLVYHATAFGVIALTMQMVGLLRWVFVSPVLASMYQDPALSASSKAAVLVVFQALHQLGGVLLGEHLGQAFTVLWMVFLSLIVLQTALLPRWTGWLGLGGAGVYLLAQLELLHTVWPAVHFWPEAGLVGSLLWLLWLISMGIGLLMPRYAEKHAKLDSVV